MSHLILFDSDVQSYLLPLTYSRPVGDLRVGILTIREKWERQLDTTASFLTQPHLAAAFPLEYGERNLIINGSVLPTPEIVAQVLELMPGRAYIQHGELIAACLDHESMRALAEDSDFGNMEAFDLGDQSLLKINRPADIFTLNPIAIREDFEFLTAGRTSAPLPPSNTLIGSPHNLFIEEGVTVEACTINCQDGPVYFGAGAVVLEGCLLRGPLAVNAGALLKMGAKIYSGTTIGPNCKVAGEVNNVVFQANSNKGHEGFLGNSVIGEWCNIGADTNASNLKNNYGEVKVWSYPEESFLPTGLNFHGLIMGDHSKCAINTMFNTGTVVGFSCNIYGEGFPRSFIPSYSWGGSAGYQIYRLDQAMATATRVMKRRNHEMNQRDRDLFSAVFTLSQPYRNF